MKLKPDSIRERYDNYYIFIEFNKEQRSLITKELCVDPQFLEIIKDNVPNPRFTATIIGDDNDKNALGIIILDKCVNIFTHPESEIFAIRFILNSLVAKNLGKQEEVDEILEQIEELLDCSFIKFKEAQEVQKILAFQSTLKPSYDAYQEKNKEQNKPEDNDQKKNNTNTNINIKENYCGLKMGFFS